MTIPFVSTPVVVAQHAGSGAGPSILLGSCFRIEQDGQAKIARDLAAYAIQGRCITLIDPNDSRYTALHSTTLNATESLVAPPLVIIQTTPTTSNFKQPKADKLKEHTASIITAVQDHKTSYIRVEKITFSGSSLARAARGTAGWKTTSSTIGAPTRISRFAPFTSESVLAITEASEAFVVHLSALERTPSATLSVDLTDFELGHTAIVASPRQNNSPPVRLWISVYHPKHSGSGAEASSKGNNQTASAGQQSKTARIVMSEVSSGESLASSPRVARVRVCEIASSTVAVAVYGTGVISLLSPGDLSRAEVDLDDSELLLTSWQHSPLPASSKVEQNAALLAVNDAYVVAAQTDRAGCTTVKLFDSVLGLEVAASKSAPQTTLSNTTAACFVTDVVKLAADRVLICISEKAQGKSILYLAKVDAPKSSNIRAALSLLGDDSTKASKWSTGAHASSYSGTQLLDQLKALAKGRKVPEMQDTFSRWLLARGYSTSKKDRALVPLELLDNEFFSSLLDIVLAASPEPEQVIVSQLLEMRIVPPVVKQGDNPVPTLSLLAPRCSVTVLCRAIRLIAGVDEESVIATLHRFATADQPSMDKIVPILIEISRASFNRSRLRQALALRFTEPKSQQMLLSACSASVSAAESSLTPSKHAKGTSVDAEGRVIVFIQDVVDVLFPLFVTGSLQPNTVRGLSKQIAEEVTVREQLSSLRGPLFAFRQFEADRRRKPAGQRNRADRNAKVQASAISQIGGGLRHGQSQLSRREAAAKASSSVGPYTLDSITL